MGKPLPIDSTCRTSGNVTANRKREHVRHRGLPQNLAIHGVGGDHGLGELPKPNGSNRRDQVSIFVVREVQGARDLAVNVTAVGVEVSWRRERLWSSRVVA
jgi:hypothetical protein